MSIRLVKINAGMHKEIRWKWGNHYFKNIFSALIAMYRALKEAGNVE